MSFAEIWMSMVAKTQEAEPSIATASSSRISNALIGRMMGDSGKRQKSDDNSGAAGLLRHVAAAGSKLRAGLGGQDRGSPAKSGRSPSKGGAAPAAAKRARTEPSPGSPPRSAWSNLSSAAPSPSTGGASPRRKSRNDGQASSQPATPSPPDGRRREADGAGAPA